MSETARFKLNLKTGEVEIEGSEAFVERQIQILESLVRLMEVQEPDEEGEGGETDEGNGGANGTEHSAGAVIDTLSQSFGEWMHTFKSDVNDLDKALITARFVQSQSATNDFKTSEVNKALKDHGIKLSNASLSLNRLSEKKLLFQTRKTGKLRFMRVSTDGQKHLATLKREG